MIKTDAKDTKLIEELNKESLVVKIEALDDETEYKAVLNPYDGNVEFLNISKVVNFGAVILKDKGIDISIERMEYAYLEYLSKVGIVLLSNETIPSIPFLAGELPVTVVNDVDMWYKSQVCNMVLNKTRMCRIDVSDFFLEKMKKIASYDNEENVAYD